MPKSSARPRPGALLLCPVLWGQFAGAIAFGIEAFAIYLGFDIDPALELAGAQRAIAAKAMAEFWFRRSERFARDLRPAFGRTIAKEAQRFAREVQSTMQRTIAARARDGGMTAAEVVSITADIQRNGEAGTCLYAAAVAGFTKIGGIASALVTPERLKAQAKTAILADIEATVKETIGVA